MEEPACSFQQALAGFIFLRYTIVMSITWLYALVSVLVVSALSLIGILALAIKLEKLKNVLLLLVSFATGAILGDAFLHLLPEAVEERGFTLFISLSVLGGIVFMFFLEKIIHWHHCHEPGCDQEKRPIATMNLIGDFFHNIIDGLIIGASYLVSIPIGIATTIAVILHEIPQAIGDFGVLLHGGFTKKRALFFNFLTALGAIVGALVALFLSARTENFITFLIPFAAGSFIYIAGSDLIPELHKRIGLRVAFEQLILFVLGIVIMFALLFLE